MNTFGARANILNELSLVFCGFTIIEGWPFNVLQVGLFLLHFFLHFNILFKLFIK